MRFAAAAAVLWIVSLGSASAQAVRARPTVERDEYGAIVRGDSSKKELALVFTGDQLGEGAPAILDALKDRGHPASFFVTGNFLRQRALQPVVRRMVDEGHYLGPHSDSHLLYCDWDQRDKSLVTQERFAADLQKNIADLRRVGAPPRDAPLLFIPPFEWYNRDQAKWCRELGVELINFTPGSGSNCDYAREGDRRFVPSRQIYEDILAYEQRDPHGLNGFLLLLHLGSGRKDPFHPMLGPLCDELARRGYEFVRIDAIAGTGER